MALSDAVTEGETCRSISPLSGKTSGRSLRAVGPDEASFFFIYLPIVNGSPSERIDNGFHIREIINQKIGMIFGKFISAPSACSHRNGARSQRFAAGNIVRCVPNYVDLGCGKLGAIVLFCLGAV